MTAVRLPDPADIAPIVVVGSMMIDQITYCQRVPEEGETLVADRYEQGFGGKGANQAVMAARLGAPVALVGCVGDDDLGRATVANLEGHGIDTSHVSAVADGVTGVAPIWVDGHGANRILVAPGANDAVDSGAVTQGFVDRDGVAVVLAQLETPQSASAEAFRLARQRGAVTILNPAPAAALDESLLAVTDWLIPNETEYELLFGRPPVSDEIAAEAAHGATASSSPSVPPVRSSAIARPRRWSAPRRPPMSSTRPVPATPSSVRSRLVWPPASIPSTQLDSAASPARSRCAPQGPSVRFPHVATWRTSSASSGKEGT